MMFDDLTSTQSELIGHVKAACQAIKFLRNVEPLDCLEGKEHYAEWVQHMNKLNTARVRLGMAAEYLHTDLNTFNDAAMYAARTGEQRMIIEEYGDDASNAENDERDDLVP
jgi:hypothetical protein